MSADMNATTPVTAMSKWIQIVEGLLQRYRYLKFGIVGASGTVLNILVLWLGQEWLFLSIAQKQQRLMVSLTLAIFLATVNNFTWNRLWTWADRQHTLPSQHAPRRNYAIQFFHYATAAWLGVALQYGLTLSLSHWWSYTVANLFSIVVASVSNFVAIDKWTFRARRD